MDRSMALKSDFVLEVEVENKTMYYYAFKEPSVLLTETESDGSEPYDQQGAMYFAVAVILIYGISIALLIGSTLRKKDHNDYEVKSFLRGYAKLDRQEKKRVKQKTRLTLLERNLLPMFPGCSFAATPNVFIKPQTTGTAAGDQGTAACTIPGPGSTDLTVSPVTPNTDEFSIYLEEEDEVFESDTEPIDKKAVNFVSVNVHM